MVLNATTKQQPRPTALIDPCRLHSQYCDSSLFVHFPDQLDPRQFLTLFINRPHPLKPEISSRVRPLKRLDCALSLTGSALFASATI